MLRELPMLNDGDIIAGKYRVDLPLGPDRPLGKGGMGIVVAATHLDLGRRCAIKMMRPSALQDREAVERFLREARAASRLRSPHAVTIHDTGTLESGAPFIVMEYLQGQDLGALRNRRRSLPPSEVVLHALQASEALREAHSMGIIHRDLKPSNLFLTAGPAGEPWIKVLDFGIAKVTDRAATEGDAPLTSELARFGTPQYMSPEQFEATRDVDARADVWSLGVTMYELMTGALPFSGEGLFEIFDEVRNRQPRPPDALQRSIPRELAAVVLRCMEKEPGRRFQSVAELAAALEPFRGSTEKDDATTIDLRAGSTQTGGRFDPPDVPPEPVDVARLPPPIASPPADIALRAPSSPGGPALPAPPASSVALPRRKWQPSYGALTAAVAVALVVSAGLLAVRGEPDRSEGNPSPTTPDLSTPAARSAAAVELASPEERGPAPSCSSVEPTQPTKALVPHPTKPMPAPSSPRVTAPIPSPSVSVAAPRETAPALPPVATNNGQPGAPVPASTPTSAAPKSPWDDEPR